MNISTDTAGLKGPLSGYRIIEFGANMTAPLGAMWSGDQGADVIKVEPFVGDQFRRAGDQRSNVQGMASLYALCNRNKRSLKMDLKQPEAIAAVKELIKTADVVIQNYRPGVMERMGLGYEDLKQINPEIIMISVSGFGTEGPYADQRVYDTVIQGVSGLTFAQKNYETGKPNLVQLGIVDTLTGVQVFQAVTAALLVRERTGEGQHVQINMLQATLAFMWPGSMMQSSFIGDEVIRGGTGADARLIFETKDHFIIVVALSNNEWEGLCKAVGLEHLIDDPRFHDIGDRMKNFKAQYEVFKDAFKHKTTAEWLPILKELDVVFAPVNRIEDVYLDPQVIASKLVVESEHPHAGPYRQAIHGINFGESPASIRRHAPMLGEHSDEILAEAGLSAEAIEALKNKGAI